MASRRNRFLLKYTQSFNAIRILENELSPVRLMVSSEIVGNTPIESPEFRLGIAKIDFWFRNIVHNSIMLSAENEWAMSLLFEQPANIPLMAPYDPTDDVLATLFNCKCNVLANEAFEVGFFGVEDESSNLIFTYADEELPDLPTTEDWFVGSRSYYDKPWWLRDDSSTFDVLPGDDDDLNSKPDCFFSLDFLREQFHDPAEVIRPNFKPKVIHGKKK